jgi:hypothetical protein
MGPFPGPGQKSQEIALIKPSGTASSMFDRGKFVTEFNTPTEFTISEPKPVLYRGHSYRPIYKEDLLIRYEAKIKNLLLHIYPGKAHLMNSIHKFYHGGNWTDFYLAEIEEAIALISDITGIDWKEATIKELEYGCNIEANAGQIINSLLTYKHKDYFPMVSQGGRKYGVACGFDDYRLKGYDKEFEVKQTDRTSLKRPLFRWEVFTEQTYLVRLLGYPPLVKNLIKPEVMTILATDAVTKFNNSIKMQQIHLSKLTAHQKLVYAAMRNPEVRDNLKIHNKEVFKKYRKMDKVIMTDPVICVIDNTGEELANKFDKLITGIPIYSISGNRGMIIPNQENGEGKENSNQLINKNSNMNPQLLSTMTVSADELIIPGVGIIKLKGRRTTSNNKNKPKTRKSKEEVRALNSRRRKKLILIASRA